VALNEQKAERYSRQIILREVGGAGQKKLLESRVLIIGAGGLGSPVALYLATAGVGQLGIVDSDRVELSNLQRQLLHGTADTGRPKAESARDRLQALNPEVEINAYDLRLTSENALGLFAGYDLGIDGSDNLSTRYLVNDACVLAGKPFFFAGNLSFDGQAADRAAEGERLPALRLPGTASTGSASHLPGGRGAGNRSGFVGLYTGERGSQVLLGTGELLTDRLLLDAWSNVFQEIGVQRNPDGALCGERPLIASLHDEKYHCTQ